MTWLLTALLPKVGDAPRLGCSGDALFSLLHFEGGLLCLCVAYVGPIRRF